MTNFVDTYNPGVGIFITFVISLNLVHAVKYIFTKKKKPRVYRTSYIVERVFFEI